MGLSDSRQRRFAGYVFPTSVARFRSPPCRASQAPRPIFPRALSQPPRKVRWLPLPVASPAVSGFILVGGLATFVFLSRPNRVHLRYGSRVRLPSPLPAPLLKPALVRLHAEQAIYMVNSFQFTRSARLVLAYRPQEAGFQEYRLAGSFRDALRFHVT